MTASNQEPEECLAVIPALVPLGDGQRIHYGDEGFYLECQCCDGSGRHDSGHLNVQDAKDYPCEPCAGTGEFRIEVP